MGAGQLMTQMKSGGGPRDGRDPSVTILPQGQVAGQEEEWAGCR